MILSSEEENKPIKQLFISYDIAIILKEKGFNEPCLLQAYLAPDRYKGEEKYFYQLMGGSFGQNLKGKKNSDLTSEKAIKQKFVMLPLYQQVINWFLNKYNILIIADIFDKGFLEKDKFCFQVRIYNNSEEWITTLKEFKTQIECYNEGIQEALKLI